MSDGTSEIVGNRQALTFEALAGQAGKRDFTVGQRSAPASKGNGKAVAAAPRPKVVASKEVLATAPPAATQGRTPEFGLSIRIELTLPSTDDPKVYDALFKSMRENLIDPYRV